MRCKLSSLSFFASIWSCAAPFVDLFFLEVDPEPPAFLFPFPAIFATL